MGAEIPGSMSTEICTTVTTIFSIIIAGFLITCRKMGFTCTKRRAPDKKDVHGSLKKCGSSESNLHHIPWHLQFGGNLRILENLWTTIYEY